MPGKQVKNTELAYMAGLVDGEGSLWLQYGKGTSLAQLAISMCSEETIGWVSERFGGKVDYVQNGRVTPIWRWRVNGREAAEVLKPLLPYLITKQRQAELFIEFVGESYRGWTPTAEFRARRLEIVEEARELRHAR